MDDPLIPSCLIPTEAPLQNKNLILALVNVGGHLGFAEGWFWPNKTHWQDKVSLEFIHALLKIF